MIIYTPRGIPQKTKAVYRVTFNTGCFYIGASANVANRITTHLRRIKEGTSTYSINAAAKDSDWVVAEIIKICVSVEDLNFEEEAMLIINIDNPLCLNKTVKCTTVYGIDTSKVRVAEVDDEDRILRIFSSILECLTVFNVNRVEVRDVLRGIRSSIKGAILRKLDDDGKVIPVTLIRNPIIPRKVNKIGADGQIECVYDSVVKASKELDVPLRTAYDMACGRYKKSHKGINLKYA